MYMKMISKQHKTSYYLYIDESGDMGKYKDNNSPNIDGTSKFFTLAGIIVDRDEQKNMEDKTNNMIDDYFDRGSLDENFKLHYNPLRNKEPPYDQLSDEKRHHLTEDAFTIIKKSDCVLLSVTINLERHYERYPNLVNPQAYAMLIMLERFQDFLEEKNGEGKAIYERFNRKTRKKVEHAMEGLHVSFRLRHYKELSHIRGHVENGDPKIHPILQLVDFFAYTVWIRRTTDFRKEDRWNTLKHKYFNLDGGLHKAGNVIIEG